MNKKNSKDNLDESKDMYDYLNEERPVVNEAMPTTASMITSFDEDDLLGKAEQTQHLTSKFNTIMSNVMNDPSIEPERKSNMMMDSIKEFSRRLSQIKSKSLNFFKKPKEKKVVENELLFKKRDDGTVSWLATYSNKYRDNDNIPEIISEASHKNFNRLLKEEQVPYPELWLYHISNTAFGKATHHIYDKRGFSIAGGYIYPDKVWVADHLQKIAKDIPLGVSHGMPIEFIKREDATDPTVITSHITKEISILRLDVAANKYTSFIIKKEKERGLMTDAEKQTLLDGLNFETEEIARFDEGLTDTATALEEEGVESKKKTEPEKNKPEEVKAKESVELSNLKKRFTLLEQSLASNKKFQTDISEIAEALVKQVGMLARNIDTMTNEARKEIDKTVLGADNFDRAAWFMKTLGGNGNTTATPLQPNDPLYNDAPKEAKPKESFKGVPPVIQKHMQLNQKAKKGVK